MLICIHDGLSCLDWVFMNKGSEKPYVVGRSFGPNPLVMMYLEHQGSMLCFFGIYCNPTQLLNQQALALEPGRIGNHSLKSLPNRQYLLSASFSGMPEDSSDGILAPREVMPSATNHNNKQITTVVAVTIMVAILTTIATTVSIASIVIITMSVVILLMSLICLAIELLMINCE